MVLSGTQYVQTSHIRRLYDVLHGDYWYVLFGVPNPDAEQRGHYLTPAAPRTEWSQSLEQMGDWIAYRYMKEVERLEREGRIINRQWLCEQLGVSRTFFMELRKGKIKIKPEHIQALKDVFNADFHFILWGVERPDISLPFRLVQGRTMRIDVYPKYIFTNRFPAEWGPNIPERDPEDEVKRIPERAYYLDLKAK